MLEPDDWSAVIDDARARHEALVGLIYATDTQALSLLSLFATLGLAAAAGVAATIPNAVASVAASIPTGTAPTPPTSILPGPLGWSLVTSVLILTLASWFCFKALGKTTLHLPGRGADFWLWAADAKEMREEVFKVYLSDLEEAQSHNRALNKRQTDRLGYAKLAAVWTPILALISGVAARWLG